MLKLVDDLLNSITMYRLMLYYLSFLLVVALVYSIFGILPFGPIPLLFSAGILTGVCYVTNKFFGRFFKVQTNYESLYITALILTFVITPAKNINGVIFLVIAAVIAMASKYILNIRGKHIFNPTAIAVVITGFTIHGYASWWIGTLAMFPFTLAGVLIVRKIRRFDLVFYFFVAIIISVILSHHSLVNVFIDSPILFFAFVMLSEPLTTPATQILQSLYGALTGILFFLTPEIALSIGNVFSYLVSPKEKLKLTDDIYDFIFTTKTKLNFRSGQYLEWTLGYPHVDSRGNRRYFTIASSPTEDELRIGVKFPEDKTSGFKKEMLGLKIGSRITASQLAGDFTLPKDMKQKLVFIAGGIGVTPFRSIIKYLMDTSEKREIILIYSDKTKDMMVYKNIFEEAIKKLGTKVIYYESEKSGHITSEFIKKEIPDFKTRKFYLSGSHGMVTGFEEVLHDLKLPKKQIKIDYFPGF